MRGRGDQVISRLPNGLVVLFDQDSPCFDLLAPGQDVEGHIVHVQENYVIVNLISEPQEIEVAYVAVVPVDDVIAELEELIGNVSGNAQIIPKALLRIIRLQQLQLKILKGNA